MKPMSTTQSVDLIASIIGDAMAIDGHEVRRLAILQELKGLTQAFYSRQQSPQETKVENHDGIHQTS